jgi:hypothetical protein
MTLSFRHWNTFWTLAFSCLSAVGTAQTTGGFANPGSRALADANSAGDFFAAGDNKILLYRDQYSAARLFQKTFPTEPSVVSGGLVERTTNDNSATIVRVCSQTEAVAITLMANGRFNFDVRDLSSDLKLTSARDLRCAVDSTSGTWAAVNLKTGTGLVFANAESSTKTLAKFNLPNASGDWTHFVALDGQFVAFATSGQNGRVQITDNQNARVVLTRSPWNEIDPHDTFATRGNFLLHAGQGQVSYAQMLPEGSNPHWTDKTNINISPCSETGGCGAAIAPDYSWIVAGTWGTYVGKQSKFIRIKTPLVFSDVTSPGTALNRKQNKFVLVGDTDAEIASLPAEIDKLEGDKQSRFIENEYKNTRKPRFAVWLKGRVDEIEYFAVSSRERPRPLFSYMSFSNFNQATGDVIVVEGQIPQKLPSHWAAVEPQVEFDAISLANEWIPAKKQNDNSAPTRPWWTDSLQLPAALSELQTSGISPRPVRVSIVDSGADFNHPGLRGVFWINDKEIPENGIDDDSNGLVDDVYGFDFVRESSTPDDEFGHGTHVAGLVNNIWSQQALLGGAFNARLRIFRALDSKGKSNSVDLARAISAALQAGTDLLNCSWGGGAETQILRDAFAAAQRSNVIVFSSAGNDGLNSDLYPQVPKKFPGVLAVGASTPSQTRARFSNWGEQSVFGFAPGFNIYSTLPEGRFGEKSGTSMASPIAASVASLVLGTVRQLHPEWSAAQQNAATIDVLCRSAEKTKLAQANSKCGSLNALGAIRLTLRKAP